MGRFLGIVFVLLLGVVVFAGELGGEVVKLRTTDSLGIVRETSLWVVDDVGLQWLRAGNPDASWLERIRANSAVELERGDTIGRYTAVPVEGARVRINALMAERYGWADRLIGLFTSRDQSVPIRLEPRP
jgi:hypothetical protein